METTLLIALAVLGSLLATGCKTETYVDQQAAKMSQAKQTGPTEKCANCQRDFPDGSLKDRNGQRLCGTCIDTVGG